MKAYIIDPVKRTIEMVEYDGSAKGTMSFMPYNFDMCTPMEINDHNDLMIIIQPKMASLLLGIDAVQVGREFGYFGYVCGKCDGFHKIIGTALLLGRDTAKENPDDDYVVLADPYISMKCLRDSIHWGRFLQVTEEESEELAEGRMPESLKTQDVNDAKSAVTVGLELGRIGSRSLH
jgi:hypothetical protein